MPFSGDSERGYVSPVAGCSDWWFGGFPPWRSQPRVTGSKEHHLGECARTISSRDYASPGRFVFCRRERRSMGCRSFQSGSGACPNSLVPSPLAPSRHCEASRTVLTSPRAADRTLRFQVSRGLAQGSSGEEILGSFFALSGARPGLQSATSALEGTGKHRNS